MSVFNLHYCLIDLLYYISMVFVKGNLYLMSENGYISSSSSSSSSVSSNNRSVDISPVWMFRSFSSEIRGLVVGGLGRLGGGTLLGFWWREREREGGEQNQGLEV